MKFNLLILLIPLFTHSMDRYPINSFGSGRCYPGILTDSPMENIMKLEVGANLANDPVMTTNLSYSEYSEYGILDNNQEEKDATLKKVVNSYSWNCDYFNIRNSIARLVRNGANPDLFTFDNWVKDPSERPNTLPISIAVEHKDYTLLKLLIEHKVNVNNCLPWADEPIFWARTKPMVELLLNHGANINYKNSAQENLLFAAMRSDDVELITLYKEKGVSPLDYSKNGESPLDASCPLEEKTLLKTAVLLNRLSPQEICELIDHKNKNGKNIIFKLAHLLASPIEVNVPAKQLLFYLANRFNQAQQEIAEKNNSFVPQVIEIICPICFYSNTKNSHCCENPVRLQTRFEFFAKKRSKDCHVCGMELPLLE